LQALFDEIRANDPTNNAVLVEKSKKVWLREWDRPILSGVEAVAAHKMQKAKSEATKKAKGKATAAKRKAASTTTSASDQAASSEAKTPVKRGRKPRGSTMIQVRQRDYSL
jgi:hypothetical protein